MADDPELSSELVDLSGIDFALLDEVPETVLLHALRRVLAEDPSTPGQYAAFQNRL